MAMLYVPRKATGTPVHKVGDQYCLHMEMSS